MPRPSKQPTYKYNEVVTITIDDLTNETYELQFTSHVKEYEPLTIKWKSPVPNEETAKAIQSAIKGKGVYFETPDPAAIELAYQDAAKDLFSSVAWEWDEVSKQIAKSGNQLQKQKPKIKKASAKKTKSGVDFASTIHVNGQVYVMSESERIAVDELVKLRRDLDDVDDKVKAAEFIRKTLVERAKEFPQDAEVRYIGQEGEVTFNPYQDVRAVKDSFALFEYLCNVLGSLTASKLMKFSVTEVEKYIGKEKLKEFVEAKPSHRTIKESKLYDE